MSATVTQEKPHRGLGDRVFAGTALAAGISIMLALAGVFIFLFIEGYPGLSVRPDSTPRPRRSWATSGPSSSAPPWPRCWR